MHNMPTYVYTHAQVEKSIFDFKISMPKLVSFFIIFDIVSGGHQKVREKKLTGIDIRKNRN